MQVAPSSGQICNKCKWRHLVAKFATNVSGAMLLPSLIQVMESISGPVVPLTIFFWLEWPLPPQKYQKICNGIFCIGNHPHPCLEVFRKFIQKTVKRPRRGIKNVFKMLLYLSRRSNFQATGVCVWWGAFTQCGDIPLLLTGSKNFWTKCKKVKVNPRKGQSSVESSTMDFL